MEVIGDDAIFGQSPLGGVVAGEQWRDSHLQLPLKIAWTPFSGVRHFRDPFGSAPVDCRKLRTRGRTLPDGSLHLITHGRKRSAPGSELPRHRAKGSHRVSGRGESRRERFGERFGISESGAARSRASFGIRNSRADRFGRSFAREKRGNRKHVRREGPQRAFAAGLLRGGLGGRMRRASSRCRPSRWR